jgi:DNA-binding beta-propeller fold protein YncE
MIADRVGPAALLEARDDRAQTPARCLCPLDRPSPPTIGALKQTIGTVRSTVAALVPASAAVVIANALLGANVAAQPNPYTTIDAWLHAPAGRALGAASSVAAARDGTLWIAERCGANDCSTSDVAPMLHADADGNVLASFGAGRFAWPHGIRVDADGNVWVTDARGGNGRGHQVLKLDSAGELLLALGEAGVAGSDTAHFNGPTTRTRRTTAC